MLLAVETALQPRRLHVAFEGVGKEGSSDSDSGGGGGMPATAGCGAWATRGPDAGVGVPCMTEIDFCGGSLCSDVFGDLASSGSGVAFTVECLPVVHGGILRNSSNVNTRGLQHFQPIPDISNTALPPWYLV